MLYKLDQDDRYSDDGVLLYDYDEVDIQPGITVLCGCNGSGKTTFMNRLGRQLKAGGKPVYKYYAGKNAKDRIAFEATIGSNDAILQALNSPFTSEGEQLFDNMAFLAKELGRFVFGEEESDERWVFIDSFDSGLSIDLQADVASFLDDMVGDYKPDRIDIYIVMAVNSYEFASHPAWTSISVQTGEVIRFRSYDKYSEFVYWSRELKDARTKERNSEEKWQRGKRERKSRN